MGNTHKGPKAFASLIHDVETKIFGALPDETWVYPGHGNDTSLGAERPHLLEWRAGGEARAPGVGGCAGRSHAKE